MPVTQTFLNQLTYDVNGAAIEVHRELGPGLLEEVYHRCLMVELELRGIAFISQVTIPVIYKGTEVHTTLRCDLLIEGVICVELKAVADLLPIHSAQLLTYMKLLGCAKGILYNFNVSNLFHDGQQTMVNKLFHSLQA